MRAHVRGGAFGRYIPLRYLRTSRLWYFSRSYQDSLLSVSIPLSVRTDLLGKCFLCGKVSLVRNVCLAECYLSHSRLAAWFTLRDFSFLPWKASAASLTIWETKSWVRWCVGGFMTAFHQILFLHVLSSFTPSFCCQWHRRSVSNVFVSSSLLLCRMGTPYGWCLICGM